MLCSWGCVLTVRVLFVSMVMSQIPSTQPPQVTYSCPVVMWRRRLCPAVTWRSPVATRQVLAPAAELLLCGPVAVQEERVVVSRCVRVSVRVWCCVHRWLHLCSDISMQKWCRKKLLNVVNTTESGQEG